MPIDVLKALLHLLDVLPELQTLSLLQVLLVSAQLLTVQGLISEEILVELIRVIKLNDSSEES